MSTGDAAVIILLAWLNGAGIGWVAAHAITKARIKRLLREYRQEGP